MPSPQTSSTPGQCGRCRRSSHRRRGRLGRGGRRALGVGREQLADQRQLGLHRGVARIELQRAAVGLAGELGVHVAQVLVRGRVARVRADRHLERGTRLVELALAGVEHGQVVVRLGQLRIILGQLGEGGDRVAGAAGLGLDHALEEAHLLVLGLAREVLVGLGERLVHLARTKQLVHVAVFVGERGGGAGHCEGQRRQAQMTVQAGGGKLHEASAMRRV